MTVNYLNTFSLGINPLILQSPSCPLPSSSGCGPGGNLGSLEVWLSWRWGLSPGRGGMAGSGLGTAGLFHSQHFRSSWG